MYVHMYEKGFRNDFVHSYRRIPQLVLALSPSVEDGGLWPL